MDATQTERNFFQMDPTQLGSDWKQSNQQSRGPGLKMSNFGALLFGNRNAGDYTRVDLGFKFKGELENPRIPSFLQEAERDMNPYVWGSTIKRSRNDEFTIMNMDSRRGKVGAPQMDISDTNLVKDGMVAGKNYPTEGWKSFGGKYDMPVSYVG